jgi:hypothetical protein
MEYDDIEGECPRIFKNILERSQLETVIIVRGGTNVTSRQLLYDETEWVILHAQQDKQRLQCHQMFPKDFPEYLSSLDDLHDYRKIENECLSNFSIRVILIVEDPIGPSWS